MSHNLEKHFRDLEFISKVKCDKTKKALMKYLANDPKVYKAIREIALNVIKENIPIDQQTKNNYDICKNSRVCSKDRKKLVVQSGGWLWLLPVVSTIIDLMIK